MRKVCPKCQIEKDFTEFSKSSARKDGRRYECKPCAVLARKQWAAENPDRVRALNRRWVAKDPERNRAKTREWSAANPDRKKESDQAYRSENAERLREQQRGWALRNAENLAASRRVKRLENLESAREKNREWKRLNPDQVAAANARRKARKLQACPLWLTADHHQRMRQFYADAQQRTLSTGVPHQVDHIVPLLGVTVCGLHVPWNLQVLTAEENVKKSNRLLDGFVS